MRHKLYKQRCVLLWKKGMFGLLFGLAKVWTISALFPRIEMATLNRFSGWWTRQVGLCQAR